MRLGEQRAIGDRGGEEEEEKEGGTRDIKERFGSNSVSTRRFMSENRR